MKIILKSFVACALMIALGACGSSTPVSTDSAGINSNGSSINSSGAVSSKCGSSSWIGGSTELCNGHLVYRDYVYDDYGASNGAPAMAPLSKGPLAPSAGVKRYPAGAENTADLVRLDVSLSGDQVVVEFELNTLYTASQTIAAIAIDTDNNPATGSEKILGLTATGADLVKTFNTGDPATNLIRGSFAKPAGSTWKIWAVLAQADGTVMNVAFRGTDEEAKGGASSNAPGNNAVLPGNGDFWEDKQAAALQAGDITAFAASVNVSDLANGVTRPASIGPGFHQRIYTSAYTLDASTGKPVPAGEGISTAGVPGRHGATQTPCEQFFNYLGKYQPYGIYIPKAPGPHGVQFDLHGCSANHASIINQPGLQKQFGEDLNRIIVVPLGRGPVGFYSDISERDVLDVSDDVLANYDVDSEQIIMGGYSMGGYGTLRMAALYPDRFAAATNWVGFTGDANNTAIPGNPLAGQNAGVVSGAVGGVGNVIDFLGNLRHVPIVNLYSGADYLVPVDTGTALMQRFSTTPDVEYDFYLHAVAEHLTYAILDSWQKEADFTKDRRRVKNPARITYRTDASLDYPEYKIKHDSAYWISNIMGRGPGYIDVDIKSLGCGKPDSTFITGNDAGFGPPPLAWVRGFRHVTGTTPVAAVNRIEATLANVKSFAVDVTAACLGSGTTYHVVTDGPVDLNFSDGRTLHLEAGSKDGSF